MNTLPKIERRLVDPARLAEAERAGLNPVAARIIASRVSKKAPDIAKLLSPTLSMLDSPNGLPDIEAAANRIALAVTQGEIIALFGDYDVDGSCYIATLYTILTKHFNVPKDKVQMYQGHRLIEGYGLTDQAVDRILAANPSPNLVITGDCGSSDEARIKRLSDQSRDCIVLDHHLLPAEGPPKSAFACVTPLRADSTYPDTSICGAVVCWLTACVTRRVLIDIGHLPQNAPHLTNEISYIGLASVADCMSLADSLNNRAIINAALDIINSKRLPCWQVACAKLGNGRALTERDLGWGISPRINSAGRIKDAKRGLMFLLSETVEEAIGWWDLLEEQNAERRNIEKRLLKQAEVIAVDLVAQGIEGLVIHLEDGHAGVHGIVAQRISQRFGRPTVCLSPKVNDAESLSGSARSAHDINIKEAFQYVANRAPDLVKRHGGHRAAAGCEIASGKQNVEKFCALFNEAVLSIANSTQFGPVIKTDGPLNSSDMTLETVSLLDVLRPYGKDFESPVFESVLTVKTSRAMGDGSHLRIILTDGDGPEMTAVWFGAIEPGATLPFSPGDSVQVIYSLEENFYNGRRLLQLMVKEMRLAA